LVEPPPARSPVKPPPARPPVEPPLIPSPVARPAVDLEPAPAVDAGVIEEARRRQRRHRTAALALLALAAAGGVVALAGARHRSGHAPAREVPQRPKWLAGAPLTHPTHLRLVVAGYGGPAAVLDVDSRRLTALPGLGRLTPGTWSPILSLYPVTSEPAHALAVLSHQSCARCAVTQTEFLVTAPARVRRIATRTFPRADGTTQTAQVAGSTAEWVLTRAADGRCTLALLPGSSRPVAVPCGDLGPATADEVVLWTADGQRTLVVDPQTGAVRRRLGAGFTYDPIGHGLAIESGSRSPRQSLSLVDLRTGRRQNLGWPSTLRFGYTAFPEPGGPLVAIQFADPAYPPPPHNTVAQASDIWLLNTSTAALTHVPGFPILTDLKASGIAWTADHRLIIVSVGGGRTAIAVWRPGQRALHVGRLPSKRSYAEIVPIT
jgi:hypothetical protein